MQRYQMFAMPIAALLAVALAAPAASAQSWHGRRDRADDDNHDRGRHADHRDHDDDEAGRWRGWDRDRSYRSAVPRLYVAPRAVPRTRVNVWVVPRVAPRAVIVSPRRFYVSRPFAFGLFIGTAAPYRWVAPPRYVYGYAPRPEMAFGAVSLDFGPGDAAVYVDGAYVGCVDDFRGPVHPLTLVAGRHRVDIAAPGYETLAFSVDVAPGALIPYEGGLRPLAY